MRLNPKRLSATVAFFSLIPIFIGAAGADPRRGGSPEMVEKDYENQRNVMVRAQIEKRGVRDEKVLAAMRKVPRHLFVPPGNRSESYRDWPLPIGEGQTISQPYIVAVMTEKLELSGGEKVLEIGTGSGYQAAILAEIAKRVYSIEIIPSLAESARALLEKMGYKNIEVRAGDGYQGWPEETPFDGIIVTAAPDHVPPKLVEQLKEGGRLVIPVGKYYQELKVITKGPGGIHTESVFPVRFVPMTGEAEKHPKK